MLSTSYKQALPSGFAYPVGAELLNSALQSTPQIKLLKLSFHAHSRIFASSFNRQLRVGDPVTVLSASYRHVPPGLSGSNAFIEEGWYNESWELTVYSVPSASRRVAREQIVTALPYVKNWLSSPRTDTWRYGRHSLHLRLRLPEGTITTVEETAA
jgi:hypothetical protein